MCLPLGFCGPEKRQEEEYDPDLECSFEGSLKGVVPFYFGKNTSMVTCPSKQGSEEDVREVEENRVQVAFRNVHVNMEVAVGSSMPHHGKKEVLGTIEINDALGDLCHTAMNRRVEQLALKDVSFQSAKTQQKFFQYIIGHFAGEKLRPGSDGGLKELELYNMNLPIKLEDSLIDQNEMRPLLKLRGCERLKLRNCNVWDGTAQLPGYKELNVPALVKFLHQNRVALGVSDELEINAVPFSEWKKVIHLDFSSKEVQQLDVRIQVVARKCTLAKVLLDNSGRLTLNDGCITKETIRHLGGMRGLMNRCSAIDLVRVQFSTIENQIDFFKMVRSFSVPTVALDFDSVTFLEHPAASLGRYPDAVKKVVCIFFNEGHIDGADRSQVTGCRINHFGNLLPLKTEGFGEKIEAIGIPLSELPLQQINNTVFPLLFSPPEREQRGVLRVGQVPVPSGGIVQPQIYSVQKTLRIDGISRIKMGYITIKNLEEIKKQLLENGEGKEKIVMNYLMFDAHVVQEQFFLFLNEQVMRNKKWKVEQLEIGYSVFWDKPRKLAHDLCEMGFVSRVKKIDFSQCSLMHSGRVLYQLRTDRFIRDFQEGIDIARGAMRNAKLPKDLKINEKNVSTPKENLLPEKSVSSIVSPQSFPSSSSSLPHVLEVPLEQLLAEKKVERKEEKEQKTLVREVGALSLDGAASSAAFASDPRSLGLD